MADIAFLLLVFFLVTTTMDTDLGLARKLPPPLPEDMPEPPEVKRRNVFEVLINFNDQLLVEGELLDVSQLREKAKEFIENPTMAENLPEKTKVTAAIAQQKISEYQAAGNKEKADKWKKLLKATKYVPEYFDSKQVISLKNDRGTSYDMYTQVQNELAAAYRELRDGLSQQYFGKPFSALDKKEDKDKIRAIKTVYPQKISEAEPESVQADG